MKVNYKEIFKLKVMLDEERIPYEFLDRSLVYDDYDNPRFKYPFYQIIVYNPIFNQQENLTRLISVIQGYGTYGENKDLLEIQGCMTAEELKDNSVLGFLTAKEVFKRIKKNYYEKLEKK